MTTLEEIAQTSDIDRATKVIAAAGNRIKRLEAEAELAFREWLEAQAVAADVGLVIDLKVGAGIAAALSEFKQRRERVEAKAIAKEEMQRPAVAA